MLVWQAYAGDKKIGGEPITCEMVFKSFQKSNIKACEIQRIFHYIDGITCNRDCIGHLKRYLESEVGEAEKSYSEIRDELGEIQLRMW